MKSAINVVYAKALCKRSDNPEWLFGGDLMETARQCEISQKISEKVVRKRKH